MGYKIGLDLMGGDTSPEILVDGLISYLKINPNSKKKFILYLTKDVEKILDNKLGPFVIDKVICSNYITPTDSATVLRDKPESSLVKAIKDVKSGRVSTIISVCNTKAYVTTAAVFLNKITKDAKISIASPLPKKTEGSFFFLDAGARTNYIASDFISLATYGMVSAKLLFGKTTPTIRLINVGEEPGKGDSLHIAADKLLREKFPSNYKGNIEPHKFFTHNDDVILADGFSGNILSKSIEGGIELIVSIIKDVARKNLINKVALKTIRNDLKTGIFHYDYRSKGAAYILGFESILFKAHGRSDNVAIFNAIKTAVQVLESDFINNIKISLNG